MFGNAFSGWHLLILLAVVLLLFGAAKLPRLAQSVGQSMRVFKSEVKTMKDEEAAAAAERGAASSMVPPIDEPADVRPVAMQPAALHPVEPSLHGRDA